MAKFLVQKASDYSKLTKDEKIEQFLEAVNISHSAMDPNIFWPAKPAQIEAYFSNLLAVNIFEKFKKDKKRFKRALDCVEPEILKTLLYSAGGITGLKIAKKFEGYHLSTEEFKNFVVCILDSIAKRRKGDEFCLGGANLVLNPKEVKRLTLKTPWEGTTSFGIKKAIAGLNIVAESLTWAIFYDFYRSAGMLVHGPYQTSKGILLCRNFFDLNPPIWNLQNKYSKLKISLIYEKSVEIKIDFANHHIYKAPVVNKLKLYSIVANKSLRTLKEIEKLDAYFTNLRRKQTKHVETLKPSEIIKKGIEIHYYMLKDFFKFYSEDWRPPKEVYERINQLGLKYWERYRKSRAYEESWARRFYDPRNNFIR